MIDKPMPRSSLEPGKQSDESGHPDLEGSSDIIVATLPVLQEKEVMQGSGGRDDFQAS